MYYRPELPLVLRGLSFDVQPGEQVGVVGRTGAGKSSLMLKLFRLMGDACNGRVLIDGVDTRELPLWQLRKSLSIIPQDPVLFSGTLRFNLDPFSQYDDAALWRALEAVKLDVVVKADKSPEAGEANAGLSMPVAEYGENWSQGQKQLICLARVLLRGSKILLLDEATSSVDFDTDALIQDTIRREFEHCTVLTIAHRLNTIIDSDRVLVMQDGKVAEFDAPHVLLTKKADDGKVSLFSNLVEELGPSAADALKRQAKDAYKKYSN